MANQQNNFKVINGKIIRSPKRGSVRYTPISNSVLQNKNLSFDARGLLSYILSLPHDWILVKAQILREHKHFVGQAKFDRIWSELVTHGYIISEKVRDDKSGKFLGWCHVAFEEPNEENTEYGKNRYRISPISENHHITKEDITTKETRIQKKDSISKSSDLDYSIAVAAVSDSEFYNEEKMNVESPLVGDSHHIYTAQEFQNELLKRLSK